MSYYSIPIAAITISVILMITMVIRKLPQLAALNIESMAEEKELAVKNRIMLDRLKRKTIRLKNVSLKYFQPIIESIQKSFAALYQRFRELEQQIQRKDRPLKAVEVKQEIKNQLIQAKTILDQDQYERAEDNYIHILSLDSKNIDACEGLIEVYLEQKDYKKAKEICQYTIKLLTKKGLGAEVVVNKNSRLAAVYADLGWIYQTEGKNKLALNNYVKATELEPNNPRFLDLLLKISILLKSKQKAWETFNALKNADPDNKKLPELKEEIEKIKP